MSEKLCIVMAQLNPLVGDIHGNTAKIIQAAHEARDQHQADLVLFSELALTGYPPEDLLLRADFQSRVAQAMVQLAQQIDGIMAVVGHPFYQDGKCYNAASVIDNHQVKQHYFKHKLPNYGVFDEKRYFTAGDTATVLSCKGFKFGLTICEDIWFGGPAGQAVESGAELILNLNASPFEQDKIVQRQAQVKQRACEHQVPILYVNQVGAQDELVFDGHSFAVDATGTVCVQAAAFTETLIPVTIHRETHRLAVNGIRQPESSGLSAIYQALVTGLRDYVEKNHFPRVVLGLSGGIDSALVLALAVDALGAERVHTVMMPSRYTAQMSLDDAAEMAQGLNVSHDVLSIEPLFEQFLMTLSARLDNTAEDTTEENIQSRCRGVLLMAISNKTGALVLATGNKSEMAVGYATLYGDMAGGFAPLKDVYKTLVFELARYRNGLSPVIPERIITRPPSAELKVDQVDQDSLPSYDELDGILAAYLERDTGFDALVAQGFSAETVAQVIKMVDRSEYKRRQAAPGIRITQRAFGKDRRYPITSGYTLPLIKA